MYEFSLLSNGGVAVILPVVGSTVAVQPATKLGSSISYLVPSGISSSFV